MNDYLPEKKICFHSHATRCQISNELFRLRFLGTCINVFSGIKLILTFQHFPQNWCRESDKFWTLFNVHSTILPDPQITMQW